MMLLFIAYVALALLTNWKVALVTFFIHWAYNIWRARIRDKHSN